METPIICSQQRHQKQHYRLGKANHRFRP